MLTPKILVLFLVAIIFSINISPVFAQTNFDLQNLIVKLEFAPSHIDDTNSVHSIGYLNLVNSRGVAVKAPQDITVQLESDDPSLASVPSEVTILKDHNFETFDIQTQDKYGETRISSFFNGKINYANLRVGGTDSSMPDDIRLKINLPTNHMHVNSEMPFSVFLETSEGTIIRAPHDIEIQLQYEKSLLSSNVDKLLINKGEYYAWGIISTNKNVGNGFIKAIYDRFDLDTSENIEITSSLPSSLDIHVFPKKVSADVERTVDVFVSLLDSEGFPAVTPQDVRLELFSDRDSVGKKLDEKMKEEKVVIKKGEFGYHFRQKLDLTQYLDSTVMIGVSSENLGVATDQIHPVEPLNFDNPLAENKTLNIFVLPQIPSNTTSILVYQISARGSLDSNEQLIGCDPDVETCALGETELKHPIQKLTKDDLYPVQANENYQAEGSYDKINIISSDNGIIEVESVGNIESSRSYGTAILSSGQKNGEVTLAATLKGVGAGTNTTEIVDVFKHQGTKIFSPTGNSKIVLDKNGYFDLFLVALDGKNRAKVLEQETKYLLKPINEVVEITKNRSFSYANVHSDSFSAKVDETIDVEAVPIGVNADLSLSSSSQFDPQISSFVEFEIPFDNVDPQSQNEYQGVLQLKDFLENPIKATKDLRIRLDSAGAVVQVPDHITIQEGSSYTTFPIVPNGQIGKTTISANVKGVIGGETTISTAPSLTKLKIFANSMDDPLEVGQPVPLKIFIDDENAESVPGATVTFIASEGATINPSETRTSRDGSTTVDLIADKGPNVSIEILANAEGYVDAKQTFEYSVNDNSLGSSLVLGLPDWILYVGIAAVGGIGGIVVLFLKKPKAEIDEEDEEYEYEEI